MANKLLESEIKQYQSKLKNLNSLSVIITATAFLRILEMHSQNIKCQTEDFLSKARAILQDIVSHGEQIRATFEGNKFGSISIESNKDLIRNFFEFQDNSQKNLELNVSKVDEFENITNELRHRVANYLYLDLASKNSSWSKILIEEVTSLLADFLVTVDSQYSNTELFPPQIYINSELDNRVAAFPLATIFLDKFMTS